jgi:hypothetical protein
MFSESQRQSTHRIDASVSFVQIANECAVDLLASLSSSSSSSSPPSASSAASLFSLPSASALTGTSNANANSKASNRLLLSDLDASADADADADAEARKLAHDVTHVVVDSAQAAVDAWATGVAQRRALAMVAAV